MENLENTTVEYIELEKNALVHAPQDSSIHVPNVYEKHDLSPYIGQEFNSVNDAYDFYKAFAKEEGFGIRIRSTKENFCIFVCSNAGQYTSKNSSNEESNDIMEKVKKRCSTSRIDCKASVIVSKAKNRLKWTVIGFNNDHNHVMVSPKSVKFLRCHKNMSGAAKNLVEKFDKEGLATGKVAAMFNSGDISFSDRDCWNHLRNVRSRNFVTGDAQAVLNFCKQKQAENQNFFYAIQCDDDARMINFFWVDARSRLAYKSFGDVITFDTTYKTNKYNMPFAPFTGLNNHCQSILFGCALLQDETEKTFEWLFQTWLEAMGGKSPVSIITDQDLAMRAAISKVFPHTRHRLCLWHIRKKFPEKLSHIYHKKSVFKSELKRCIHDSPSIKHFEEDWHRIMVEYDLEKNEWLQSLYNMRDSWVPVYNRNTFFAGMNTTQRSESINAFFDAFVNSSTTLRDFVVKFDKAVDSRYEKEKKEDFESRHRSRVLRIGSKIEEHVAAIYTRNIFKKIQDELEKFNQFTKEKIEKNGSQYVYKVSSCFKSQDSFVVSIDLDIKVAKCDCQLFEFMGILCRHILVIFQAKNIFQIPDRYILRRWTKDANKDNDFVGNISNFEGENYSSATLRSVHVHNQASLLSDLAEKSEKVYKFISFELDQTYKMAKAMYSEMQTNNDILLLEASSQVLVTNEQINEELEVSIRDPLWSKTKGRQKDGVKVSQNGRFKNTLEVSTSQPQAKRRSCQICGEQGHNRRSCNRNSKIMDEF